MIKPCKKCGNPTSNAMYCSRPCQRRASKNKLHGLTFTPEHVIWRTMKNRCRNPKCKDYPKYGGRGIDMCDRWWDDFRAFLDDMGTKPSPEYTVERIDNDRGYEPDNCKWGTRLEQSRNRSCTLSPERARLIKSALPTMSAVNVAQKFGCSLSVVYRIRNGKAYAHVCALGEGGK